MIDYDAKQLKDILIFQQRLNKQPNESFDELYNKLED